jgi:uncharacterized protein YneF (UPF0154 family)
MEIETDKKSIKGIFQIGLIILISFLILGIAGLVGYYIKLKIQEKKFYSYNLSEQPPIPKEAIIPSEENPTPSPTILPSPDTKKMLLERVELKVTAIGGGTLFDKHEYTFTFNKEPEDTVEIIKRQDQNMENIMQDYNEEGFLIKNKDGTTLKISPVFEGVGMPLEKKLNYVTIFNPSLTGGKLIIYRLDGNEFTDPEPNFFSYTTNYHDNPEECDSWGDRVGQPNPPACIWGGMDVLTKDSVSLSISCKTPSNNVIWCDNLVMTLKLTKIVKYPTN